MESLEKRKIKKLLVEHLETRAKEAIQSAVFSVLSEPDVMFLSGMGIDGKKKMLDVFIKQCKLLKKENF